MSHYSQHVNKLRTPQNERARADQVENSAGGFAFAIDKWTRLDRFLILGSESPTYYASAKQLTTENVTSITECIAEDGLRTVGRIVEISDAARAPKNDPAIFALAMCSAAADVRTRQAALGALGKVCRTGTHLFSFLDDLKSLRGYGRAVRRAVSAWYNGRTAEEQLALQVIKYQQREGRSHRDVLRLAHPKPKTPEHDAIMRWVVTGGASDGFAAREVGRRDGPKRAYKALSIDNLADPVQAFERLKTEKRLGDVVRLIREHELPHEAVPNEWKNRPEVWDAILPSMGMTALLRNLGKLTDVGLLKPMSSATAFVVERLTVPQALRAARIHPIQALLALGVYTKGKGVKSDKTWTPVGAVVDALDASFYASFKLIEPTGKRTALALDISDSMTWNDIAGAPGITPRIASAAMAMITACVEPRYAVLAFSGGIAPIAISPRQRLDDVISTIEALWAGTTDCALPMIYALEQKIEIDTFVIYTDNDTHAGYIHPFQALRDYRNKMGIPARLVVVGMTSTGFSIADSSDRGMLDVVGFDSAAPGLIADFARGDLVSRKEAR